MYRLRRSVMLTLATAFFLSGLATNGYAADSTLHGEYVQAGGSPLYVQSTGVGPPIVFLHGGIHHFNNSFSQQIDYFAAAHRVIGIDQAGHGHSPARDAPLSYQTMADDTAKIIVKLGLGPVDVVGHSDGADVGLLLARDYPQLIRRLVISGANLRAGLSTEEIAKRHALSAAEFDLLLVKFERRFPPSFRTDFEAVTPDGAGAWMRLIRKSYALWIEPIVIPPADLKRIDVPVLVIAGDHDFTELDETAEIFHGLPHAELLIVPHTGHDTFGSRSFPINAVISEFLDRPAAN